MIVTCKDNECAESVILLPEQFGEQIGDDNFVVIMGYTVDREITEFHIHKGHLYAVYGILVLGDQIRFLIQDDDGRPFYCPAELFSIKKSNVLWDWEIARFPIENKTLTIIGYPAMEGTYSSIIDLVSHKGKAIKDFLKYKDYVEENKDAWELY